MSDKLEAVLKEKAKKICKKYGIKEEYEIILSDKIEENIDILITYGNPPIIHINLEFVLSCLENKKDNIKLMSRLQLALEKLYLMQHTLAITPIANGIALRKDTRRWLKLNNPDKLLNYIDDKYFQVSYEISIKIKDSISGSSITVNTNRVEDIHKLERISKKRLAAMIVDDDTALDLHESKAIAKDNVFRYVKIEISKGDNDRETKVRYE